MKTTVSFPFDPELLGYCRFLCFGGGGGGGDGGGGGGGGDGGGGAGGGSGEGGGGGSGEGGGSSGDAGGGGGGAGAGGGSSGGSAGEGAGGSGAGEGAGEGAGGAGAGEGAGGAGAGEGAGGAGAGESGGGGFGGGTGEGGFGGGTGEGGFGGGSNEGGGLGGGSNEGGGLGGGSNEGGSNEGGAGAGQGDQGGPDAGAPGGPEAGPEAGAPAGPEDPGSPSPEEDPGTGRAAPEEEPGIGKGKEAQPEEEPGKSKEFQIEEMPPPPPPPPPPVPPPPPPIPQVPTLVPRDEFKLLEPVEPSHLAEQQQENPIITAFQEPGSLFLNPDQLSQLLGVDPNQVNTTQGLQNTLAALGIDLSHVPGTGQGLNAASFASQTDTAPRTTDQLLAGLGPGMLDTSISQGLASPAALGSVAQAASSGASDMLASAFGDAGGGFFGGGFDSGGGGFDTGGGGLIGGLAGDLGGGGLGQIPGLSDLSPMAFASDQDRQDRGGGGVQVASNVDPTSQAYLASTNVYAGATPNASPGSLGFMGGSSGGGLEAAKAEIGANVAPPGEQPAAPIELPEVTVTPEGGPNLSPAGTQTPGERVGTQPDYENPSGPLGGTAVGDRGPSPPPEGGGAAPETKGLAEAPPEKTEGPGEPVAGLAQAEPAVPGEKPPEDTRSLAEQAGLKDIPAAEPKAEEEPKTEDEKSIAEKIISGVIPEAEARGRGAKGTPAPSDAQIQARNPGDVNMPNAVHSGYAPGAKSASGKSEGGPNAKYPDAAGNTEKAPGGNMHTIQDFLSGKSQYVTVASDPSNVGRWLTIDGSQFGHPGTQILGYVHDTGSSFKGQVGRFDWAVAPGLGGKVDKSGSTLTTSRGEKIDLGGKQAQETTTQRYEDQTYVRSGGTKDEAAPKGPQALNTGDIGKDVQVDRTFSFPTQPLLSTPDHKPDAFIIHQTDRVYENGVKQFVDSMKAEGKSVHFFVDKDGKIWQTMPLDQKGGHIGGLTGKQQPIGEGKTLQNNDVIGVEVEVREHGRPSEDQKQAVTNLSYGLLDQFPKMDILGHGEIRGNKDKTEGDYAPQIRSGELQPTGGTPIPAVPPGGTAPPGTSVPVTAPEAPPIAVPPEQGGLGPPVTDMDFVRPGQPGAADLPLGWLANQQQQGVTSGQFGPIPGVFTNEPFATNVGAPPVDIPTGADMLTQPGVGAPSVDEAGFLPEGAPSVDEAGFIPQPYIPAAADALTTYIPEPPEQRGIGRPEAVERSTLPPLPGQPVLNTDTLGRIISAIPGPVTDPYRDLVPPNEMGMQPPADVYQGLAPPDERGLQPPIDLVAPDEHGLQPPVDLVAPDERGFQPPVDLVAPDERGFQPPPDQFAGLAPPDERGLQPPAEEPPYRDEHDEEQRRQQEVEEEKPKLEPLGAAGPKPLGPQPSDQKRAVDAYNTQFQKALARASPEDRKEMQKYAPGATPQMKQDLVTGKMSPIDFMAKSANNVGVYVMGFHVNVTPADIRGSAKGAAAEQSLIRDVAAARGDYNQQISTAREAQQAYSSQRGEYEARLGAASQGYEPYTAPAAPAAPTEPPLGPPITDMDFVLPGQPGAAEPEPPVTVPSTEAPPTQLPPQYAPVAPAPPFPEPPSTAPAPAPPAVSPPVTTAPPTTAPPVTTPPATTAPAAPVAPDTTQPTAPAAPAPSAPAVSPVISGLAQEILADIRYGSGVVTAPPDQVRQAVRQNPGAVAAFLRANPTLGPALLSIYTPEQLGDMFGDIGFARGESNPPPPPPPTGGLAQNQQQQQPPVMTMAQGGLVNLPGYYQKGGPPRSERDITPEQRRKAIDDYLQRAYPPSSLSPAPRVPLPPQRPRVLPEDMGEESELEARDRMAAQPRAPLRLPPGMGEVTEGSRWNRWALPWRRPEQMTPAPQERALPPAGSFPMRTFLKGSDVWSPTVPDDVARPPEVSMQRGGALGVPQMNTAFKQAHFTGLNTRASIPKPPGIHLIHSSVPGRVDRIPMQARSGSYVLPADVVSGMGQGNTHAGAKMWGDMIAHSIGPMGIKNAIKQRSFKAPGLGVPRGMAIKQSDYGSSKPFGMSRPFGFGARGFADGGETEYTPIITAGGEMVVDPEIVAALGDGDPNVGKKMLADSAMDVRKHVVEELRKLPKPVK